MMTPVKDAPLKRDVSKEELVAFVARLLRADGLSFLTELDTDDIGRLVAAMRMRLGV